MSESSRRAVLLARPGAACERLRSALADAGANLVLEADPTTLDPAKLEQSAAQVVVVALDPVTEDIIERFDPVLANPSVEVIYEEAALAATREGWDLARWMRHLAAKLHGHGDVLPPGHEPEDAIVPDPAASVADAVVMPVAAPVVEAAAPAVVPVVAPPVVEAPVEAPVAPVRAIEPTLELAPVDAPAPAVEVPVMTQFTHEATYNAFDPVAAEATFESFDAVEIAAPLADLEMSLSLVDETPGLSVGVDDIVVQPFESSFDFEMAPTDAPTVVETTAAAPVLMFDASRDGAAPDLAAPAEPAPAPAAPDWSFADESAEAAAKPSAADHRFQRDLGDLERRISSLELVEDRAPARIDGAVLVLAGIGGPDAVRQLLSGLPEGFPRPVLVQQRLDGGRYDRLVAQMQRATPLQVRLAEPGLITMPGTIYILPNEIGLSVSESGMRFTEGDGDVLSALPSADSAVLMLSGSDPARVDAAMNHSWAGALVAGQAPDGCYDAAAASALIARGADAGQPVELAARLAARWH
ncbi:chemotaxis protein CheB [Lysobacter sp. LF1]|uniref:protein-glutamate methylesterase n=1 Tax=Lysobacter stagni TaxID=3045172 RepID=A0ABT6XFI6_9GAMM|nr:chemotaxis protein CheB [Lysobacter sp. LF1]MDI9238907.1 chemotaxis protein CheB [Lysobacter sp. LF1]